MSVDSSWTSRLRVTALAAGAALFSGAALFYRKLRRGQGRVERLAAAALESLLNAIDANDPETGGHVRRVAAYSLILSDASGVGERERRSIERVALFHDIGKIQQALFDITHADAALSPADRALIATHPARGADVVAPLTIFYPDLGDGVLSHHERWDGDGYPRKLRGVHIPFAARVVAIADTFDAITHLRRYGQSRTFEDAVEVVAAERGKQFDPSLVDVFLTPVVLDQFREAINKPDQPPELIGARTGKSFANGSSVPDVEFRWRDSSTDRS